MSVVQQPRDHRRFRLAANDNEIVVGPNRRLAANENETVVGPNRRLAANDNETIVAARR